MNGMKPARRGRSVQAGSSRLPSRTTLPLADDPGSAVHRRQHPGAAAAGGLERVTAGDPLASHHCAAIADTPGRCASSHSSSQPREPRAPRLSAPSSAGSSGGCTTELPRASRPSVTSSARAGYGGWRRAPRWLPPRNALVESQLTRATGAIRTAPARRSSAGTRRDRAPPSASTSRSARPAARASPATPARPSAWRGGRVPRRALTGTARPESPTRATRDAPPLGGPGLGSGLELRDADVGRRRSLVGPPTSSGADGCAGESGSGLEIGQQHDLAGTALRREHLARQRERVAQIEPPGRDREATSSSSVARSPRWGMPSAVISQSASSGVARASTARAAATSCAQRGEPPTTAPLLGELSTISTSALGAWPGTPLSGSRRAGGGEHDRDHEQRSEQQEQPVLELEPALMLPGGGDEIADRGEDDGRGLSAGQQVEQDGDGGRGQSSQHPRVEKSNHAGRGRGVRAWRRTTP